MFLVSSCSCLCTIQWSLVLSREWRCSWSNADRQCSNYIWVSVNFIAYNGASYIRDLTVFISKQRHWWRIYCPQCSAADCLEIVETCRRHNVILAVCHVLRYMPQSLCVEQLINNGEIGDVVNIQLREPVSHNFTSCTEVSFVGRTSNIKIQTAF